MLHTKLSLALGLETPLINAGMAFVAGPALAAAVSNAGGLGMLGTGMAPPEGLRQMIRATRTLTTCPFGVDLLGTFTEDGHIDVLVEEKVPVAVFFWDLPSSAAGAYVTKAFERLGIAEEMKGRLVPHRGGGFHAARVVKGEADLAVQAEHEIRCVPGAEFVPYPEEFRRSVVFMAGTSTNEVTGGSVAGALLTFLRGPETTSAIKARCLQPG